MLVIHKYELTLIFNFSGFFLRFSNFAIFFCSLLLYKNIAYIKTSD